MTGKTLNQLAARIFNHIAMHLEAEAQIIDSRGRETEDRKISYDMIQHANHLDSLARVARNTAKSVKNYDVFDDRC